MLQQTTKGMEKPMVFLLTEQFGHNPFMVLISCLLSLRTKDTVTLPVCQKLFKRVQTPQDLLKIFVPELEQLIYPAGFYRRKARLLHAVCADLINRFDAKVPANEQDLLSIKGVGRKTMNLVLGEGFGIPAICVDTHVHRISNRLGLVKTKTPEQTETQLKLILPREYWIDYNRLLVTWGQNICVPISPFCSQCAIYDSCERIGVKKHR
jgi:endonuclease-3